MAPRKRSVSTSRAAPVALDLTADALDITIVGDASASLVSAPLPAKQLTATTWRLTPAMLSGTSPLPDKPQGKRAADAYATMTEPELSACFADGVDAEQDAVDAVLSSIENGGMLNAMEAPKQRAGARRTSARLKAAEPEHTLPFLALEALLHRQDCTAHISDRRHPSIIRRMIEHDRADLALGYACAAPDLLPASHGTLLAHLLKTLSCDESVLALCARPVVSPADAHTVLATMNSEQMACFVNVLHGALQRSMREDTFSVEHERAALNWLSFVCVQHHVALRDNGTDVTRSTAALLAPVQQTIEARCAMSAEIMSIGALAASLLQTSRAHCRGDPRSVVELTASAVAGGALSSNAYVVESLPF